MKTLSLLFLILSASFVHADAIDRLLPALSDPSTQVQATALASLGKVSESLSKKERKKVKKNEDLLILKLSYPDQNVRLAALYAVSKLRLKKAIPMIEDRLLASSVAEQSHAALALGRYGMEAKRIVPALRLLVGSPDRRLSTAAIVSINAIDGSVQLSPEIVKLPYEERYTVVFTSQAVKHHD